MTEETPKPPRKRAPKVKADEPAAAPPSSPELPLECPERGTLTQTSTGFLYVRK